MSTAVADIRQGLVTNLRTKFPVGDYQITGYILEAPTPPCFDIEIHTDGIEYDLAAARGYDKWMFTVRALIPKTSDIGSQVTLDNYLESSGGISVKEALESDTTLGGTVDALQVTHASGPRAIGVHSQPTNAYHGCEFTVQILARGA